MFSSSSIDFVSAVVEAKGVEFRLFCATEEDGEDVLGAETEEEEGKVVIFWRKS